MLVVLGCLGCIALVERDLTIAVEDRNGLVDLLLRHGCHRQARGERDLNGLAGLLEVDASEEGLTKVTANGIVYFKPAS